jgi:hypothetical protein
VRIDFARVFSRVQQILSTQPQTPAHHGVDPFGRSLSIRTMIKGYEHGYIGAVTLGI